MCGESEGIVMSEEVVQTLEKEVMKRKRVAAEWAGRMHDLAEERLPEGFSDIQEIAEGTFKACQAWKEAADALKAAKNGG
jgi:hypothetical protein